MRELIAVERLARSLSAIRWTLVLCTLWVAVRAVAFRSDLPRPALADSPAVETGSSQVANTPLDSLSSLWQRDIRQTLIEPPPPPPAAPRKEPPPPPPPKLPKLLATFEESNRAWGLFLDDAGNEQLRAVGTQIDLFEITSVTSGTARLRNGTNTFEVEVPREEQGAKRSQRRG